MENTEIHGIFNDILKRQFKFSEFPVIQDLSAVWAYTVDNNCGKNVCMATA